MTKTSWRRTFSSISTCTSPSENLPTSALPSGMPSFWHTDVASGRLALPVNTSRFCLLMSGFPFAVAVEDQESQDQQMAGAVGFEPTDAGIKTRCLGPLGDAPLQIDEDRAPARLRSRGADQAVAR